MQTQPIGKFWQLRTKRIDFGSIPKLMGIVNVTPDSFSDGGHFYSTQTAIDQALRMEDEGADIVDIGGESTRPYSLPVDEREELDRIMPVIEGLISRLKIPISVDTSKATVAKGAIDRGAEIVNDVTGLFGDPDMIAVIKKSSAGVCVMHMQGTPQTMQDNPQYGNATEEILDYLDQRLQSLVEAGVDIDRICLDPGIGFGKTHEHNLELLRKAGQFLKLGRPILIGHSRKGFIAKIIGDKNADRTAGSIGVSLAMARHSISILRVHDVASTKQALRLFEASGGLDS